MNNESTPVEGKTTLIADIAPASPELRAMVKDLPEITTIKPHDPSFALLFAED